MKSIRNMLFAALFAAMTCVGGWIRIPAPGFPITLQFFFCLAAGLLLGAKWGAVSQIIYLLLGLLGLPVFSLGGGLSYIMQPSFGFLLGLIPAATVAGLLRKKPLMACLCAWAVLYATGLPYLHVLLQSPSFWDTVKTGCLLFLPGDVLKILACVFLCPKMQRTFTQ